MTKYRYRESWGGGLTNRSIEAFKNHIGKVGKVKSVRGYVYYGRHNTNHVGVLITGDKGTIRLGGLSWGYGGEGVRGLRVVLSGLNISENEIQRITSIPWQGWSTGLPKGKTKLVWDSVIVP